MRCFIVGVMDGSSGVVMGFVVKRVKGKLYVYERYSIRTGDGTRRIEHYIGPLEELVRVYQMYKRGLTSIPRLHPKTLRKLAKDIAEEVITRQTYKPHTLNTYQGGPSSSLVRTPPLQGGGQANSASYTSKPVIPEPLLPLVDNRAVLLDFHEWLERQKLDEETVKYYYNTIKNKREPDREKRVKAWRKFVEFLSETGRISYNTKVELLDRLKPPPAKKHYGRKAIPVETIKQYIEIIKGMNLGWLAWILLGGARLSHVLEMLRMWGKRDEIVEHTEGVLEPRLYCSETFCRFLVGITSGYKRCLYVYFPRAVLDEVRPLNVKYRSLKDQLHARGVEIGVFRDFATQRLQEQARLKAIPSEAVKFILTRELTVTGAHYLNTRDWADELFHHYIVWLQTQGLLGG